MVVQAGIGCRLNLLYRVFAGGLTNVNVIARDRVHEDLHQPAGSSLRPIQDTAAFPCP